MTNDQVEETEASFMDSLFKGRADRIVALSAIFISLMTLFTFISQNKLLKKQAALSVLPYLAVTSSYSNAADPTYQLRLTNQGVGPAIIEHQKIQYQGKVYEGEFFDFLRDQIPGLDSLSGISRASFDFGSILPSGDELFLIGVFDDLDAVNTVASKIEELSSGEDALTYEIVYRSIYGERWKITESSELPVELPRL